MLKRKKRIIAKVMATTMLATTLASTFAVEANAQEPRSSVTSSKISGDDRYKTAVEISKNYSSTSKHAVVVNGQKGIVDALTATPYASLKKAPILMTQNNKLNEDTKKELTRRGIKTVDIIGGTASVSDSVKAEIEKMGITVNRIAGNSKYETSLKVAKEVDKISNISKIAVANGEVLADAVSVAAPAAQNKMPIILAHPSKGLDDATKTYIKGEGISTSYVIGGTSSVSNTTQNSLPGTKKRLEGTGRQETNAKVVKEFYDTTSHDNIYVTKSGQVNKADEIADALAVGVLAAHNQDPVLIVGKNLAGEQKTLLEGKDFDKITEVGNGIPAASIQAIKDTQNSVKSVTTVAELNSALSNAKDGDVINFKPSSTVSESITLSTSKNVTVNLDGTHSGNVTVNMASGNVNINGNITGKVSVDAVKTINIKSGVTVKHLEIKSSANKANIVNKGTVTTFDVLASGVVISGSGNITTLNPQGDTDYSGVTGEIGNLDTSKPVSQVVAQNAKELVIRFSKQIDKSSIIATDGTLEDGKITLTKTVNGVESEQEVDAYKATLDSNRMALTITAPKGKKFDGTYRIDVKEINSNGVQLDDYSTTFKAEDKVSPTVSSMAFNQQDDIFEITLSEPIDDLAGLVLRVDNVSVDPIEKPESGTKIETTKKLTIKRSSAGVALNSNANIYIAGLKDAKGNTMVSKTQSVSTKNDTLRVSSVSTISDNKIKLEFNKKLHSDSDELITDKTNISVFKNSDTGKIQQIDTVTLDPADTTGKTYILNLKSDILGDKDSDKFTLQIDDKVYKDETGTKLEKYSNTNITLTKDKVAPTVKSSSVTSDKKSVEVVFSEDITLGDNVNTKFRVVRSGSIVTTGYEIAAKTGSSNTIIISEKDGSKLDAGVYKINLSEGIVKDVSLSQNTNKSVNLEEFTIASSVGDPLALGTVTNQGGANNIFRIEAPEVNGVKEKFTLDSLKPENFKLDGNAIDKNTLIHYAAADNGGESAIIVNLPSSDTVNVEPTAELTISGLKLKSGKLIKEDADKIQKKATVNVEDNTAPDLTSASIKMDASKNKAEIKLVFNENMQVTGAIGGTGASAGSSIDNVALLKDELIIKTGSGASEVLYDYFEQDEAKIEVSGKEIKITITATGASKLFNVIKNGNSVTLEIKKLDNNGTRNIKDANGVDARVGTSVTVRPTSATL